MTETVAVEKHFVQFYSPGTLFSEVSSFPIDDWNVDAAVKMANGITERHGAVPYGFRFVTKGRSADDLDSRVTNRSHMYFLGGKIRTYDEVLADNLPDEETLRFNMRANGYDRVIVNTNSWKCTLPLDRDDVVLDYRPPKPSTPPPAR